MRSIINHMSQIDVQYREAYLRTIYDNNAPGGFVFDCVYFERQAVCDALKRIGLARHAPREEMIKVLTLADEVIALLTAA